MPLVLLFDNSIYVVAGLSPCIFFFAVWAFPFIAERSWIMGKLHDQMAMDLALMVNASTSAIMTSVVVSPRMA